MSDSLVLLILKYRCHIYLYVNIIILHSTECKKTRIETQMMMMMMMKAVSVLYKTSTLRCISWCQLTETIVHKETCRLTRTYKSDSEPPCLCSYSLMLCVQQRSSVGLNSVRREIVSYVTIVFYDKVRGRNKPQR